MQCGNQYRYGKLHTTTIVLHSIPAARDVYGGLRTIQGLAPRTGGGRDDDDVMVTVR